MQITLIGSLPSEGASIDSKTRMEWIMDSMMLTALTEGGTRRRACEVFSAFVKYFGCALC